MKRRSLAMVAMLPLALMATVLPSAADETPDEQYTLTKAPTAGPGWIGAYYDASSTDGFGPSLLWVADAPRPNTPYTMANATMCSSLDDPACASGEWVGYDAYLPECETSNAVDCIAGLQYTKPDGTVVDGAFQRRMPATGPSEFQGDAARGIPSGRAPSLWRFPGVTHQGGQDFIVLARLKGGGARGQVLTPDAMRVSITPVSTVPVSGDGGVMRIAKGADGSGWFTGYFPQEYVHYSQREAAIRWAFPEVARLTLTLRLSQPRQGWFHGRVSQPEVQVTTVGSVQTLQLSAAPVAVPVLDVWGRWDSLPSGLRDSLSRGRPGGNFSFGSVADSWDNVSVKDNMAGSEANVVEMQKFLSWLEVSNDVAAASKTQWSFRTMSGSEMEGANRCFKNGAGVLGVVATNSTMYLAGPPTFNAEAQTLDYKVAAPHFAKDGKTANVGTYSLLMKSDIARCLYDFSNAPISASVSVVSGEGTEQVATTVVEQKDGWLKLGAAGFYYSAPTVRVAISQTTPVAVAKPAIPKKTITCIKGKAVKKVTAVAPKCPAGFKKR